MPSTNNPLPLNITVLQGPTSTLPTKDLEAAFARRAMMLMRRLLGEDALINLLRPETLPSTEFWRRVVADSHGECKPARIVLSARGLMARDFVTWFLSGQDAMKPDEEKLAAHPEHWVVRPGRGEKAMMMTVLETLGERPTLFELVNTGTSRLLDSLALQEFDDPFSPRTAALPDRKSHLQDRYRYLKKKASGIKLEAFQPR
ncbi:hypothetical protein BJX70DRAFT_393554 [Aspergillus crustosus]